MGDESDEEIDTHKKSKIFLKTSEPELAIFNFTSLERIGKWLQKCFHGFRVVGRDSTTFKYYGVSFSCAVTGIDQHYTIK